MGVARARREPVQGLCDGFMHRDFRDEQIDPLPDHLGFDEAEHPLAGGVECLNHTVIVDGEHDIFDVIENDLEMLGALLACFMRQGACFVRHQSHRLHDAASLVIDRLILRADELQQDRQVRAGGTRTQTGFLQLSPQLGMKIGAVLADTPLIRPDESGRCAGTRIRGCIEGPLGLRI